MEALPGVRHLAARRACARPRCRCWRTGWRARPKPEEFFAFEPVPFGRGDVAPFLKAAFGDDGQLAQTLLMRTGIEALMETPLTLTLVGLVARTSRAGLPRRGRRCLLSA